MNDVHAHVSESLEECEAHFWFNGERYGRALGRLMAVCTLLEQTEHEQEPLPMWVQTWIHEQRRNIMPSETLIGEALLWQKRLRGRRGWRVLSELIARLQDLQFERSALLYMIQQHKQQNVGQEQRNHDVALYTLLGIS